MTGSGQRRLKGQEAAFMKNTTPINDGVINADEAQNVDERTNMPLGVKKPKKTRA